MATQETCQLKTSKGMLTINLYPQVPNLSKLFVELVNEGAYDGCKFDQITESFVHLEGAKSNKVYKEESHTLVKYGRRGTVALLPDLGLIITTDTASPATDGSVLGVLASESVFIIQEIADGSTIDGLTPQFPCYVQCPPKIPQATAPSQAIIDRVPPSAPKAGKKRIRMFDAPVPKKIAARKFKPNPNVQETDLLFQRLKSFEASLRET